MIRRIPIVATIVVLAVIATMIALGVWQLRRADWKDALLAEYATNAGKPPIAFPAVPVPDETLLYRRASGNCLEPVSWTARAGTNRAGESGWRHIALCRRNAEGPGMAVDLGWSKASTTPTGYKGGMITGTMDFDRDHVFLLVADSAAPGLQPSARPSPANIPNNHRAYAVQWFLFAFVALTIYGIALRRRMKSEPPPA